jgi:hypothetical protein
VGPAAFTTEFEDDVNGGPPLEVLLVGPVASTTEFEDDIDVGAPGGRYRWVRQRPPLTLKTSSMAAPLGGTASGSDSVHHRV